MLPVRDIDQNFLAKNPYIQYAIACMRPNVVNSTAYSLALIRGARIHYTASDRDREITMGENDLQGICDHIEDMVGKECVISYEIGADANGRSLSLRLTVFEADYSKFRYILMFNNGFFSVYHTVKDAGYDYILSKIRTFEEAERPVITRLDASANGIAMSSFKLSGLEKIHDPLYPRVKRGMGKMIRDFFNAKPTVLTLMGEYGSGKSSLLRAIATEYRENREFFTIDDTTFYQQPALFTEVIAKIREVNNNGKQAVIFMEECDAFVKRKSADNPFLSRFLSIADGTTGMDVKFILAVNVSSEEAFDEALLRDGRADGIIGFHQLTPTEANRARVCIGMKRRKFTHDVSLAVALGETRVKEGEVTLGAGKKTANFGFTKAK